MSAKGRGTKTKEFEHYETPEWVCREVTSLYNPEGKDVFEPGCDVAPFLKQAKKAGCKRSVGMDIRPVEMKEWVDKLAVGDFLDFTTTASQINEKFDYIYMNPPFTLATKFVMAALDLLRDEGTIIVLQRLNWLAATKRYKPFFKLGYLDRVHVLVQRPRFTEGPGDACEYGIFAFSKLPHENITLDWINRREI
jgi:hypothetical protein